MNEEGLKALPESIHDWDEVKNSDDPTKFWDRITNLRKKFGTGLFTPGKDAGDEDWGKFTAKAIELSGERLMPRPDLDNKEQRDALYKTLGRPDSAEGYKYEDIENVTTASDSHKKFLGDMAFAANLTQSQLKALDETIRTTNAKDKLDAKTQFDTELGKLKAEWGLTFDDRVNQANKVAKIFFKHLGDTPSLSAIEIQSFFTIAKQLGTSSKEFEEQGDQNQNDMTPQEATDKIAEIRSNGKHPYFDKSAAGHLAATKRMSELYKIKNNLRVN